MKKVILCILPLLFILSILLIFFRIQSDLCINIMDESIPMGVPQSININDYGIFGDGETDNTKKFQKLLNNIKENTIVELPEGVYLVRELRIPRNNVTIIGNGNVVIKALIINYNFIQIAGNNIELNNIVIDGNNLAQRGVSVSRYSENITIEGVEVKNISDNNKSVEIAGINVYGDCDNIVIDNCYIHDIVATPDGKAGNAKGASRGILVSPLLERGEKTSTNVSINNCTVENIFPSEDGDGIVFGGGINNNLNTNSQITNCIFNYCSKRAIKIMIAGMTVSNNKVFNEFAGMKNDWSDGMYSAISIYDSNVIIKDNEIKGKSFYAPIEILANYGTINSVDIINNVIIISNDGTVLPYRGSIYLGGELEEVKVENNDIENTTNGIYIRGKLINSDINFNKVIRAKVNGIYFDDYKYNMFNEIIIKSNTIEAEKNGISLGEGDKFTLVSNNISAVAENVYKKKDSTIVTYE